MATTAVDLVGDLKEVFLRCPADGRREPAAELAHLCRDRTSPIVCGGLPDPRDFNPPRLPLRESREVPRETGGQDPGGKRMVGESAQAGGPRSPPRSGATRAA
jgi:hypothetical protein